MNNNSSYVNLELHGLSWVVETSHAYIIQGNLMENILNPSSCRECRIIRENNVRVSMLFDLPEQEEPLFVKHYKCRGISDTLKYFLRRSKVSSEWKTIHAMLDKNITVARPLAKAERRVFRCLMDSFLITEALVNAQPLGDYLTSLSNKSSLQETLESRRSVIQKVAGIIAKIHREGFFYRDLHAGNILVSIRKDGSIQIYPIDFHKVWHFRRLPLWMRVRDLAQLKNSLNLSQTDQLRFLKRYARKSPVLRKGFKEIVKKINKKAAKLWKIHLKSRTKRCLVESSEFSVKNAAGMSLYFRKMYSQSIIMEILRTYDTGNYSSQVTVLKKTKKQVVSTVSIAGHEVLPSKRVLVKESRVFGLTNRLFQTLTRSRAKKAWVAGRGLQVRGVNTPSGLALIEMKHFGLITRTILINEFVENAYELNDFVIKYFKDNSTKSHVFTKDSFITHLAETLKNLHDSGIYHADLKSNNILVNLDDKNKIHFYFVDLDRVHFKDQLSFEQMANNLAQINASIADCISPRDRLKFFRIYAEDTPRMINRKRYFKRIIEIGRKKNTRPYGLTISNPLNTA